MNALLLDHDSATDKDPPMNEYKKMVLACVAYRYLIKENLPLLTSPGRMSNKMLLESSKEDFSPIIELDCYAKQSNQCASLHRIVTSKLMIRKDNFSHRFDTL